MKKYHPSIRLKEYDYTQNNAYFITIVTFHFQQVFGKIHDHEIILNEFGEIAYHCWKEIPLHFPKTILDEYIIMPDHLHGIIIIDNYLNSEESDQQISDPKYEKFGRPVSGSIPTIVRSYKSAVSKRINGARNSPGKTVWQQNYYEHIIRNEMEWDRIQKYILANPYNKHICNEYPSSW